MGFVLLPFSLPMPLCWPWIPWRSCASSSRPCRWTSESTSVRPLVFFTVLLLIMSGLFNFKMFLYFFKENFILRFLYANPKHMPYVMQAATKVWEDLFLSVWSIDWLIDWIVFSWLIDWLGSILSWLIDWLLWYRVFDFSQLFATIVKFGWFDREKDEFVFRSVVSDVMKFIEVAERTQTEWDLYDWDTIYFTTRLSVDCSIDRLNRWSSFDWLIDWCIGWSFGWLIGSSSFHRLIDWLIGS